MSFNPHSPRIIKDAQINSDSVRIGNESASPVSDASVEAGEKVLEDKLESLYQQKLFDADEQAEALMAETRQESVRLLNETHQKVKAIEDLAYQEGFRKGEAEGQKQLAVSLAQFQNVMLEAIQERERILSACEQEVVHLILEVVRKILQVEPIINEQVLTRVIRGALERLGRAMDVHIYVNPEDVELLHFSLNQIQDLALEIIIEADPDIAPGGCKINSQTGEIDATLKTQFEAIVRPFLAVAEGSTNSLQWTDQKEIKNDEILSNDT